MFETADDVLEHFGVKGMQWGVRNKPKGEGRASLKEHNLRVNTEKRDMHKARAEKGAVRISEINAEIAKLPRGSVAKRYSLNQEKSATATQRRKDIKAAAKEPGTGLTSTQKKVLVGAAVAGIIVGGAVAVKYGQGPEGIAANIRRGASRLKYGDEFRRNSKLSGKMSAEELRSVVAAGVNPNYATSGGQMNCRRCTFAYELRRRGYDVVATTSPVGYGQNESGLVNALVKGDKNIYTPQSMSNFASGYNEGGVRTRAGRGDRRQHGAFTQTVRELGGLKAALGLQPDGARGEAVFDMGGFAHSMQWENVGGVPHIFDSQKGSHYPVTTEGLSALTNKWGHPNSVELTRLDNVPLDAAFLQRWARNA